MSQRIVSSLLFVVVVLGAPIGAQQAPSPNPVAPAGRTPAAATMTNQDVTALAKSGMKDDALTAKIAGTTAPKFDLSPDALMALKVAGVSDAVINAMMQSQAAADQPPPASTSASAGPSSMFSSLAGLKAASVAGQNGAPGGPMASQPGAGSMPPSAGTTGTAAPGPVADIQSGQFRAFMTTDGSRLEMPVAQSRVAPVADAKGDNLSSLAVDNAVGSILNSASAISALSSDATGASNAFGGIGGAVMGTSAAQSALGGLTHLFGSKKTTTYLWAVPRRESSTQTAAARPTIRIGYDDIPSVDPTQFEPVLVHLQVTSDNWRIVGAAKSDSDPLQQQTWQVYTKFIQDIVVTTSQPVGRGLIDLTPTADLPVGEYAIVLRPIDAKKKFASGQFKDDSGEVRLFNAVFDFSVTAKR